MLNTITVLLVQVGKEPVFTEVEPTLEGFRKLLGGNALGPYIEHVRLETPKNTILICDEEGLMKRLPPNRLIKSQIIVGDFFLTRITKGGQEKSLRKEDMNYLMKMFSLENSWPI